MQRKWPCFLMSFLAGACLCLNDRFQPFHLRSLRIKDFSTEAEMSLRDWGDSFLGFHPAWLLARKDLREFERKYPLKVKADWTPWRGELELTAVPFVPSMKLVWRHSDYLVAEDGTAWRGELWRQSMSLDFPELPSMDVGASFPLMKESDGSSYSRLNVPYGWLHSLWTGMHALKDVKVDDLLLARRGGEDVITCVFQPTKGGGHFSFTGNVSGYEKSLMVVKELIDERPDVNMSIDATYEDKIIIRRESEPIEESS